MSKLAVATAIALTCGNAWAQAAFTGKQVLGANTNKWNPALPATAETNALTGTFHAGGVAACDGCHVMHNANAGVARSTVIAPWSNAVPAFLLQGSDQSSTCLNCHADPVSGAGIGSTRPFVITNTGASVGTMNYSPGGDFGWLRLAPAAVGDRSGHNVVALDFGMAADATMKTAPGGTYTPGTGVANGLACSTCHDPHGRFRMQYQDATSWVWAGPTVTAMTNAISQPIYASGSYGLLPKAGPNGPAAVGSYRLLAGVGYSPASALGGLSYVANPPVAVAPADYNHSEAGGRANEVRVAYGTGMSEWCANCHTNIHIDNYTSGAMGASGLRHPAGQGAFLKPGQVTVYQNYVSSGIFTAAGATNSYTSLVPFENAGTVTVVGATGQMASLTALATAAGGNILSPMFQVDTTKNVMCLSCHRAHASSFSSLVRWNVDDTFITNSDLVNFVDTQGRTNAGLTAGYYGRTPADFGIYQRSMCNKCHGKD
jgi:hypothetical protein